MMKLFFDNIKYCYLPDPGRPILFRVNRKPEGMSLDEMEDMYWGYSEDNRFSIPDTKQMYLATSLDCVSEATPWEELLKEYNDSTGSCIPFNADELSDYYVSYIRPLHRLNLLDITEDFGRYVRQGSGGDITNGSDYEPSKEFSKQCYEQSKVDGIYYRSAKNPTARNVYLFERSKPKFGKASVVAREPLVDVIKPMVDVIAEKVGIEILI